MLTVMEILALGYINLSAETLSAVISTPPESKLSKPGAKHPFDLNEYLQYHYSCPQNHDFHHNHSHN